MKLDLVDRRVGVRQLRDRAQLVFEEVADADRADLRDELTRWIDAALLTSASVPSYVERRLEAAFDEIVRETGLGRG